jgi:L-lactate dehydrogenase complex protein LldG
VAIVGRLEVVPALADYLHLARTALASGETSAGIMITGPSRTADIEGQLIVGVHGPREIHLVLMD